MARQAARPGQLTSLKHDLKSELSGSLSVKPRAPGWTSSDGPRAIRLLQATYAPKQHRDVTRGAPKRRGAGADVGGRGPARISLARGAARVPADSGRGHQRRP